MPVNYKEVVAEIVPHLQNSKLKTFDIIFKPEEDDTSPVICIEHNLGIESWCIKDLYLQAYDVVFKQDPGTDSILYDTSILILLLLNPNIKTLWNKRRTSTLGQKNDITLELNFTKIVLTRQPKSQDALNYRKWLLNEHNLISYEQFVQYESNLIFDAANRHENNHVVWDYGIWYLNSCDSKTLAKLCVELWDKISTWISTNVSDYSALHFRQFLIEKLTDQDLVPLIDSTFKKKIISQGLKLLGSIFKKSSQDEDVMDLGGKFETSPEYCDFYLISISLIDFESNTNLISFYNNHEALWNHRRFLCYHFLSVLPSKFSSDQGEKLVCDLITKLFNVGDNFFSNVNDTNLFVFLFSKIQGNFLGKCGNISNRCYSERYIDWLKKSKMLPLESIIVTVM